MELRCVLELPCHERGMQLLSVDDERAQRARRATGEEKERPTKKQRCARKIRKTHVLRKSRPGPEGCQPGLGQTMRKPASVARRHPPSANGHSTLAAARGR